MAKKNKNDRLITRKKRVRAKISGTPQRPRLSVYKSNTNIYAQLIDDVNGVTLASANSLQKDVAESEHANVETAKKVGAAIGKSALEAGIEEVVFDRNGYLYHGKVKALAEAAREAGLKF
ncbi:50S ribosomal protein L18 [Anaerococcus degeneri]|uniref:Large ribosomal subunit protein uL18 n=1 Tax=Anaerococcus degeneri TaxID=361500 RepID=A0ABS7YWA0_9FIRM|nr:50S ribosomal protein L18 [Anaerococcus degeneri]MBP2015648.1 large subunit ribosomal protein L18 [Anaerococcus degeneri]MCA2096009.1 50S ribosomal protein L18 [Anaerococcus degeneri]